VDIQIKDFLLVLHGAANTCRHLLDKRLKPLGLSQAKWRTLLHLLLANKPLTQIELARSMGIEGATLVGLLDRLAKEGWIERHYRAGDRRVKMIHLTDKAKLTLVEIQLTANQVQEELLAVIPEQDVTVCINVLRKISS
jgi:MarR family transcriptional regulator for hemolysin